MRTFPFFLLIILLTIILSTEKSDENKTDKKTINEKEKKEDVKKIEKSENKIKAKKENKSSNKSKKNKKSKKKKQQELVPPPPLSFISDIPDDTYNLPNDDVYLLTDITFDKVLQNGNNYRWFVILFSETCGHCYFTRTEVRKILPDYKYSSYLRFAEIEININPMTNMRFNIEGVPYIFMLQNNTMYIMDLYPSRKNLIKFIEMDLSYFLPEEKKPFPPPVQFKKKYLDAIKSTFQEITDNVNGFLKDYGIKYEFTPFVLFSSAIMIFVLTCTCEYFCCLKYCPDEEELKEEKEENQNKEKKGGKKEKDKDNGVKEEKEVSEEEKIKREKEKEKEKKEEEKKKGKEEEKKKKGEGKETKSNNKKKKKE